MRSLLVALALAFLVTAPPGAVAQQAAPSDAALQGFVDRVMDDHVRPAAFAFEEAAGTLSDRLDALCEAPDEAALAAARESFHGVVGAWGEIAFLAIDPMRQDDRQARIHFWPDPRGVTLRQVQGVLAEEDPTATDAATLAGKSVAVQGLGALEFLLFGTGADELATPGATYRCRYARAIGGNLQALAASLSGALAPGGDFALRLAAPGPDNPLYRDAGEAAEDLIGSAGTGIELVRDRILRPAMGESATDAQPKTAPFWRSDATLDYAGHMLSGIAHMLEAGGIETIVPEHVSWLAGSISFEFATAEGTVGRVAMPFVEAVRDDDERQNLTALLYSLSNARDLVTQHFMSAAGLKAGFNALDGD